MGIFSRLRREKALTGTPAVLETLSARQLNPYIPLGGTNLNTQRINSAYVTVQNASYGWIYKSSPSVRRVIDYLAGNVAQLGLKLYERVDDDDRRPVGDHPAALSLRRPNPSTPGKKFIRGFVTDFLAYDNAYALKFGQGDAPRVLVQLSPSMVGIIGQSHFQVEAYRIWRMDGTSFDVDPSAVLHWRGENPEDPRRGESKLETLREELAADAAARQANTELHRSGLALPGWVERPLDAPEWSDEAMKRWQESFAAKVKKATREVPVLEEGMAYKTGGVTPEDAELLAARTWTNDQIASLYGMKHVPPEGDEERRQFYTDVLPDITGQLTDFLGLHILEAEYGLDDHYFEFNLDEKLMGDERIKSLTSAAGAPIMLRDEARSHLNLPALPDGEGQEIVVPLNVTEGGKPTPQTMPIQDPNKPSQDGDHRTDGPIPAGQRSLNGHSKAPLIPRRRRASERRDRWAKEYQGVLDRHFDRQRRSLKSRKAKPKAITDDRWNTELGDGLNDVAERQFEVEGAHVAFRLASTFNPNYGENWLAEKSIGTATAVNATTQQHADEADLDKAFEQAKVRSAGAAMAYATDVAAFSTRVAVEQAPGEPTVTIDGGECEVCAPFQGSWPAGELEQWPAYHANCGCVADVMSAAPAKAVPVETKAAPAPIINVTLPEISVVMPSIPEGAVSITSPVTVEPAEVNVTTPDVNVAPAQVHIEKGAVSAPVVNVESPEVNVTTPDVNVAPAVVNIEKGAMESVVNVESAPPADIRFDKGAFAISTPVHVEAPPPADVRIDKDAFNVNVSSPDVTVEAPQPPNVNVEVKGGKTKKTVTFSDGKTAEITDELQNKRRVEFSDGRTAEINEEES